MKIRALLVILAMALIFLLSTVLSAHAWIGSTELQNLCDGIMSNGTPTKEPPMVTQAIIIPGDPEFRFYASIYFLLTERGYVPIKLTLMEEQWTKKQDQWIVSQWIISDMGIDGAPEQGLHNEIIERESGFVLSYDTKKLSRDDTDAKYEQLIKFFISRVSI